MIKINFLAKKFLYLHFFATVETRQIIRNSNKL